MYFDKQSTTITMKKIILLFFYFLSVQSFGQTTDINPAEIDFSFNMKFEDYIVNGNVADVIKLANGKTVLVGGGNISVYNDYYKINSGNKQIIRLNADNTYDSTLNMGTGFNNTITKVLGQSDGKLIVFGTFTTYKGAAVPKIIRLNVDGSLDTSFVSYTTIVNPGNSSGINLDIVDFQLDTSDNIYFGLRYPTSSGTSELTKHFKKFNSSGVLVAFNEYGLSIISGNAGIHKFYIQNDGKILLKIYKTVFANANQTINTFVLVRLNSDLTLDTTFNSGTGFIPINGVSGGQVNFDFMPLDDGKVYVQISHNFVASPITYNDTPINNRALILNLDGTIYSAYDPTYNEWNKFAKQNDGKIILDSGVGLFRLNSDLSIDNSFTKFESYTGNPASAGSFLKVYSDRIYFNSALTSEDYSGYSVMDYNGNFIQKDIPSKITKLVKKTNNEYILINDDRINSNCVKVIDGNGNRINYPNIYNINRIVTSSGLVRHCLIEDCKVLANGKIIMVINTQNDPNPNYTKTIKRFNSDFSVDTSFQTQLLHYNATIELIGDKIFINNYIADYSVTKLNDDGTLDTSFNLNYNGNIVGSQPDGKFYVSRPYSNSSDLFRVNQDGSIDTSFNLDPVFDQTYQFSYVNCTALSTGKILLFRPNYGPSGFRLNSDGSIDNSFNIISNLAGPISVLSDGSFFVSTTKCFSNGIIDTSFNLIQGNGYYFESGDNLFLLNDKAILSLSRLKYGRYGSFYNGQWSNGLFRLITGDGYLLKGKNKFDFNNNGCDNLDLIPNNLKLKLSQNGNLINTYIPNSLDQEYNLVLSQGAYDLVPEIEMPNYFNVSPTTTSFNLTPTNNVQIQDYCVTANGVKSDLEVVLAPTSIAQPGFDATYDLIYRNKGNQTISGSVTLNYNDNVMDYVSATPSSNSSSTGSRVWNFTNLKPFETKQIRIKLNLNSPTETPALNGGDILNYSVNSTTNLTDQTPTDNSFILNQPVVNSYDPNDKICLQGQLVGTNVIGEYVHYRIRFENTGSTNATNINVVDFIDTTKFDISTLLPISGSHMFTTKITEGNKVEFYFKSINLGFLDASNDGYLVYKIKTKSSLVAGDTFGGNASIYFDYNSPILTNTYITLIQVLGVNSFNFEDNLTLYPNPAESILNINKKSNIEITSMEVYNLYGQLIMALPNANDIDKIDVSSLSLGTYFIKVHSDKGISSTKFIKK